MPPTEYQESRTDVRWKLLGSLLFVAGGLAMALSPEYFHRRFIPDLAVRAIGIVAVLFFGMAAAMWARTYRKSGADLIVSDEGVTHHQWGHLDWSEVRIVQTRAVDVYVSTQRFIEIIAFDPDALLSRMSPVTRSLAKLGSLTGHSPFTVAESTLAVPFEQVLADMQQRHQRFLGVAPGGIGHGSGTH